MKPGELTDDTVNWILAAFLLLKTDLSALYVSGVQSYGNWRYGTHRSYTDRDVLIQLLPRWWHGTELGLAYPMRSHIPALSAPIGIPIAPYHEALQQSNGSAGLLLRNYSRGRVVVNPTGGWPEPPGERGLLVGVVGLLAAVCRRPLPVAHHRASSIVVCERTGSGRTLSVQLGRWAARYTSVFGGPPARVGSDGVLTLPPQTATVLLLPDG